MYTPDTYTACKKVNVAFRKSINYGLDVKCNTETE